MCLYQWKTCVIIFNRHWYILWFFQMQLVRGDTKDDSYSKQKKLFSLGSLQSGGVLCCEGSTKCTKIKKFKSTKLQNYKIFRENFKNCKKAHKKHNKYKRVKKVERGFNNVLECKWKTEVKKQHLSQFCLTNIHLIKYNLKEEQGNLKKMSSLGIIPPSR